MELNNLYTLRLYFFYAAKSIPPNKSINSYYINNYYLRKSAQIMLNQFWTKH